MASRFISVVGAIVLAGGLTACGEGLGPADGPPVQMARGPSNDSRVEIALAGTADFPESDGKARFRDRGGERELQIEVEDAPTNVQVSFLVGGDTVGTATTNATGDGRLNLNTDQGDTVPASVAGLTVKVLTPQGTVIISGAFGS